MDDNKKSRKFNIWMLFSILFFVAALVLIGIFIKTMIDQKNRADHMSELVNSGAIIESKPIEQTPEPSAAATPEVEESTEVIVTPEPEDPYDKSIRLAQEAGVPLPDFTVDIQQLQETENPEIYAWIYVPGTKVNYPVLQHPADDTYYLNYNIDGTKGYPGCIYTEAAFNEPTFWDANTVLYGHNMKNGTMFGSLHKYEDSKFFEENRYIYVFTQERLFVYKIFAAYDHSNEHLLFNHNFASTDSFLHYFEKVKEGRNMHRIFADDVELTGEGQHIITLSTCINNKPENRFLVQGVLINEE